MLSMVQPTVIGGAHQREVKNKVQLPYRTNNQPKKARDRAMSPTEVLKMNLEVHIVPVWDVDRAKAFYDQLGWRLDDDVAPMEGLRIVQFTPPGSGTSITFGKGLTTASPGSTQGALVVSD